MLEYETWSVDVSFSSAIYFFLSFYFEIGPHNVAQAGLKLSWAPVILLSQPPIR